MDLTRRQFTAGAAVSLTALAVLGCEERSTAGPGSAPGSNRGNLATAPFRAGSLHQYVSPGVYDQHKPDKGVWLVSDGKILVALSATCTHNGCTTHWDQDAGLFVCPCHHSRFNTAGAPQPGAKAGRPLERCTIRTLPAEGGGVEVEIDPTQRFREDQDQWSDPNSFVTLPAGDGVSPPPAATS